MSPLAVTGAGAESLCEIRNFSVSFDGNGRSPAQEVLKDINFKIAKGEAVGLLGESGSGKSTLAMGMLRALPPYACVHGSIIFEGRDLMQLSAREMRAVRGARISIIFQEPGLALNPLLQVGTQIMEVLRAHIQLDKWSLREEAKRLLAQVELADVDRMFKSYPHELSGGQAQRVLIAQALACHPALLIADEPTASLDSTVQAEILKLLAKIRRERDTALLFITHNPALLLNFTERVMIMHKGRIVEQGPTTEVFRRPTATFTRSLLSAMSLRVHAAAGRA